MEILAEIREDGGALRPETKTWVSQIKAVHFDFGITEDGDPCMPHNQEKQDILQQQLIDLIKLIQEKGKRKFREQ